MSTEQHPGVLIVGAGPVGLGAALELTRFGVRSTLIEKHEGTSWHPKTRNFNTRTMEIAMGWGPAVYRRLRNIDTPPGWKSPIRFLESVVGREFGTIDSKGFEGPGLRISPASPVMSSQELIEGILLDAVQRSGLVDVRFRHRAGELLRGGADDDRDVALEVENLETGTVEVLSGAALVAADGATSPIREQLGLELEGARGLRHIVNCYFRADIESRLGDRRGVLFFVANASVNGVLQPLDAAGRWLCQISVEEEDWSPEAFTAERARTWIRNAVGDSALDVEVLSIGFWRLNATVVERFAKGRVLLCGDAAHQFPPTGGLGVNTGLQGMHNAMWKLAYHVQGLADWSLVGTYDTERRDVSTAIVQQSLMNSMNVVRIQAAAVSGGESGLSTEEVVRESRRYGNHLGVEFGATYVSPAVIPDGSSTPKVADDYADYAASACPGRRAPHVWLGKPQEILSTLDLFGRNFTLIAGPSADVSAGALQGLPVDRYLLGDAGLGDPQAVLDAYEIEADGAVLVRPDGHVAWRCRNAPIEYGDAIRRVLSRILATNG